MNLCHPSYVHQGIKHYQVQAYCLSELSSLFQSYELEIIITKLLISSVSVAEFPQISFQFQWTRLYNSSLINDWKGRGVLYIGYATARYYDMALIALIGQHSKTHRYCNQPIWDDRIMDKTEGHWKEQMQLCLILCSINTRIVMYLHSEQTLTAI
jgi:hypothetical protein